MLNQKFTYTPIPLKLIRIEGEIVQSVAELKMIQEYVNFEDTHLETIFLFPKDSRIVIHKITTEFKLKDGSTYEVETKILKKEKLDP